MSDTPDRINTRAEPTAEELLVLDLLYDELEEVQADAARQKVDASALVSEDFESLSGIRALFAQLVDEEPPAASTARLLHAAAAAAPSSRATPSLAGAGPGLWSRFVDWFRPLMGSPTFAAATMLVVVAGVAGALYLSGDGGNAQPTVASQSEDPSRSSVEKVPGEVLARPAVASPSAPALDDLTREVDIAPDPNSRGMAGEERPADVGATGSGKGVASTPANLGKSAKKKRAGGAIDKLEAGAATKRPAGNTARLGRNKDSNLSPSSEPQSEARQTEGMKSSPAEHRVETVRPTVKPAPRKPRRTRSTTVSGTAGNSPMVDSEEVADEVDSSSADSVENGADRSKTQRDKAAASSSDVRGLHKRALQAAKDGECEAVRSLGTRIRGLDSRYFASSFARDSRLQACLGTAKAKKTRSRPPAKK